jgi:hypothetical protein
MSDAPTDLRLLGLGLNECEIELNECCWPVVLNRPLYSRLFALGVYGDGVSGCGPFGALQFSDVLFRPAGRFELAREVGAVFGLVEAIIIPVYDEAGDIDDLAAWNVDTGALALWRGVALILGEEWINAPRIESQTLTVFADVGSWLRAGRRGVVVLDAERARWRLAGESLAVEDPAFGRRIRDALRLPEPKVFVASKAARRAA